MKGGWLFKQILQKDLQPHPPIWFRQHPDNRVGFSDIKLPYFDEAVALCCSAHRFFLDFFIIAWDVAILEDGPIILEANPAPDLTLAQALFGGLKKPFLAAASRLLKHQ